MTKPKAVLKNAYGRIHGTFTENLPTKFLQHYEVIDWENYEFLKVSKQFGWFGKEANLPVATNLYAKWELHKYQIEVLDFETKEPVVLYDEDGKEIENLEFYITAQIKDEADIEQFVKDYMGNVINETSTEDEKKQAESQGKIIAMAPRLEIKQIWNFHLFDKFEDVEFVDVNGDILEPIDRTKLEIKFDEENKELELKVENVVSVERYDYITDINYYREGDYRWKYDGGFMDNPDGPPIFIESSFIIIEKTR